MSFADSLSRRRAGGGGAFDAGASAFAGGGGVVGGVAGGVAGGGAAGRVAQGGRAPAAGGGSFSAGQGFGAGGSSTDGGVQASGTVAERAVGAAQAAAETFARAVAALSRALADGADDSQVLGALLAEAEGAGRKAHAEISRVPCEKLATASKLRTDVEERLDLQLARLRREVAAARLRSNRSASGDAGGSAATSSSQRDQGKTGNFMNGGASPWASELGVRDGSRQVQEEDAVVAEERRMLQEQQKRAEQEAQEIEAQIAFNEDLIAEREEGIEQAIEDIHDIKEVFQNLATLVAEQGETLEDIDDNMTRTAMQTKAAVGQLKEAHKMSSKCAVM